RRNILSWKHAAVVALSSFNKIAMKTKYYQYTLQGEHSTQAALQALGTVASQGTIVRIDTGGGHTHVHLAAHAGAQLADSQANQANAKSNIQVKEVAESDVT